MNTLLESQFVMNETKRQLLEKRFLVDLHNENSDIRHIAIHYAHASPRKFAEVLHQTGLLSSFFTNFEHAVTQETIGTHIAMSDASDLLDILKEGFTYEEPQSTRHHLSNLLLHIPKATPTEQLLYSTGLADALSELVIADSRRTPAVATQRIEEVVNLAETMHIGQSSINQLYSRIVEHITFTAFGSGFGTIPPAEQHQALRAALGDHISNLVPYMSVDTLSYILKSRYEDANTTKRNSFLVDRFIQHIISEVDTELKYPSSFSFLNSERRKNLDGVLESNAVPREVKQALIRKLQEWIVDKGNPDTQAYFKKLHVD